MKYKGIVRLIESEGWSIARQRGSHRVYKHPERPGIVIIAGHKLTDEVPRGTLNAILKQAGLK